MLKVWAEGVKMACSFEAEKVVAALQAAGSVDTILGSGPFTGAEMWGIDNMVSTPIPVNEPGSHSMVYVRAPLAGSSSIKKEMSADLTNGRFSS